MRTLLACLLAGSALTCGTQAVQFTLLNSSQTLFEFTLTDLDQPSMTGGGDSFGTVLVLPGPSGYQVVVAWEGLTVPFDQFSLTSPFGVDEVSGFEGTQVAVIAGGLHFVYGVPEVQDSDGDGIPDDLDACPNSIMTPAVWVGDCDTGVVNATDELGCTLADKIDGALAVSAAGARNHGKFVSAMARYLNGLVAAGTILGADQEAIMACVGPADEAEFR